MWPKEWVTWVVVLATKLAAGPVTPATVGVTWPVIAPGGTRTTIMVSLQVLTVAGAPPPVDDNPPNAQFAPPLKVTLLVLCVAPKPVPSRKTVSPTLPTPPDTAVTARAPSILNC